VGKEVSVLFEEEISVDGKRYMTGFTKEYIKVAYPINDSGEKLANEIRNGRITGFLKNDLMLFEI
jgi:threonylcarbamoyladenosine tRNA methylthiotransferase MtaB